MDLQHGYKRDLTNIKVLGITRSRWHVPTQVAATALAGIGSLQLSGTKSVFQWLGTS